MINRVIVAGIGTEVGKTVASAILTTMYSGDYWKPIQTGDYDQSDTVIIKKLVDTSKHRVFDPAYSFQTPVSPHHASKIENRDILKENIQLPSTDRPLIIESVGGIFVPLSDEMLTFDLFKTWNCPWIVVSKNYLGSINHTLMTIRSLQTENIPIMGIVFNGIPNPETESVILKISGIPCIGKILPEKNIDSKTIKRYATEWSQKYPINL